MDVIDGNDGSNSNGNNDNNDDDDDDGSIVRGAHNDFDAESPRKESDAVELPSDKIDNNGDGDDERWPIDTDGSTVDTSTDGEE
jgi:hypothetical protein